MTQAINCPGCSKQIVLDDSRAENENIQLRSQVEQLKKTQIPLHIPNYQCKGGTCGQNHENPRYNSRPKGKCNNCDQFSIESTGKCTWCDKNEIEEIDKDELEDLGIRLPN